MTEVHNVQFSPVTDEWVSTASLSERKKLGQYMTPGNLRQYLLSKLEILPGDKVLDPGVGTGEFLKDVLKIQPKAKVFGWDVDEKIAAFAKQNVPEATLTIRSALDKYKGQKFDFVIGNPPYFEIKLTPEQKQQYLSVIAGRPNIYGLFFMAGLEALKPGGTLAFVVPPSMNAGAYFKKLRSYIVEHYSLTHLKVFSDPSLFKDAQTSVQVIVIKKQAGPSLHTLEIIDPSGPYNDIIFTEAPEVLLKAREGKATLSQLGYVASTGSTVWNLHKQELTNDSGEGKVPLLYARNITDQGVKLKSDERRPQYISTSRIYEGPAIIANRIIGTVGKGDLRAALVPRGMKFAAENHLNVIQPDRAKVQLVSLKDLFEIVTSTEVIESAMKITGNTQLSATEWNHVLPLPVNPALDIHINSKVTLF